MGAENSIHAWSLVRDVTLCAPIRSSVTPSFNSWEAVLDADPVHAFVWRMAGSGRRRRRETALPTPPQLPITTLISASGASATCCLPPGHAPLWVPKIPSATSVWVGDFRARAEGA